MACISHIDLSDLSIEGTCEGCTCNVKHLLIEHWGYMWHTCLSNASQSHVICLNGWFNLVINLHHHVSLKCFYDLTMCKSFQKCFKCRKYIHSFAKYCKIPGLVAQSVARPTADPIVLSAHCPILSRRLIMKQFPRSFSSFRWFKVDCCQLLGKVNVGQNIPGQNIPCHFLSPRTKHPASICHPGQNIPCSFCHSGQNIPCHFCHPGQNIPHSI